MDNHTIRFANLDDVDDIMNFIDNYWKKDHILATNKSFFLYEYVNDNDVNFVLAIDNYTKKIVGLCGFIKNTINLKNSDIWGSVWKVIKTNNPMLGVNILEFLNKNSKSKTFSSCGIAPKTIPIYDFLRFHTGKLKHYYRLNNKKDYKIAEVNSIIIPLYNDEKKHEFFLIRTFEELINNFNYETHFTRVPFKDYWYLDKRYFNHPIYSYKVFGIKKNKMDSFLVTREVVQNGVKILRIVDFIGDVNDFSGIGNSLQELIDINDYEYIDLYCNGISKELLSNAGLKERDDCDTNVIPNYFEPFIKKNIDLYYFTNSNDNILIFKGDGDQDRPSLTSN